MKKTEIIETKTGKLQGYIDKDLSVFKGIPYAEPPIGKLRLNNPILKKPWDGILEALKYGPEVPQPIGPDTPQPRPIQSEEECLTLNIWTPATDSEKRPVMMWIHGGAFIYGSNSRALYDGSNLSQRGNIVVVSINYRLGPFANLSLPGAKANVGMLDQITALEWICDNIDYFGGDPNNVTIFGESAGGVAACTLMAMPKAKGLFRRVIAESNGPHPLGYRKSTLEQSTEILLEELNFKSDSLDEFQKLPWEDILKATERFNRRVASQGIRLISGFAPYVDGDTLPTHPLKAIREGFAKDIELIIGCNSEEAKFNHLAYRNFKETEPEELPKRMLRLLKNTGEDENKLDEVVNTYKNSREENNLPSSPQDILDAYSTDQFFRIPAIKFAEAQSTYQKNTYMYLFSWGLPNHLGSMHGLEIGFVFNNFFELNIPFFPKKSEETKQLSERMMDSWISFAKDGDPNHIGIPEWPSYDTQKRSTIIFDKKIKIWEDPLRKEREMWNKMNVLSKF